MTYQSYPFKKDIGFPLFLFFQSFGVLRLMAKGILYKHINSPIGILWHTAKKKPSRKNLFVRVLSSPPPFFFAVNNIRNHKLPCHVKEVIISRY